MNGYPFNSLIQLHCSTKRHAQIIPTVCKMQVGGGTCKRRFLILKQQDILACACILRSKVKLRTVVKCNDNQIP